MRDLVHHALTYRAWADWTKVAGSVKEPERLLEMADRVIEGYPAMRKVMRAARKIVNAYPRSDGARVLREMLEVADEKVTMKPGFLAAVKKQRRALRRR